MKKPFFLIFIALLTILSFSCSTNQATKYNLDFEQVENGRLLQWKDFENGNYILLLDSLNPRSGKYSGFIECTPDDVVGYRVYALEMPANYEGKELTLTGYVRTEGVSDGYAGLWAKIEPNITFDNMSDRGIIGTTDWTKYEITLPFDPNIATRIVVGGALVGKGKVWIDDLKVFIDGKDIQRLKPIEKKEKAAKKDKEFDNGSGITEVAINEENIDALKELGLIWGFLKYYHPAVAEGNYNWDYELFRIIPKVINEKDCEKRSKILLSWIDKLGKIKNKNKNTMPEGDIKIEPDLDWINHSGFSSKLITKLTSIENADRTGVNYYVRLAHRVGNPQFENENPYTNMKYPDTGYRILSLFRYWNMIQYYFPYKNLIEEDWKDVLEEFIPKFIKANDETEYALTALALIARIHDTHANIFNSNEIGNYKGGLYAAPRISFVEDKAVVIGFYNELYGKKADLRLGDIITEVNNKKVESIIQESLPLTPASNYPTQLREIARDLLRTNFYSIDVVYERNGKKKETKLETYRGNEINTYSYSGGNPTFQILPENIAYLYPGSLKIGEIGDLWKDIEHTKGLIVDLRCYPSDFIVYSFGEKLMPETTPFAKFTNGNLYTPGLFTFTEPFSVGQYNPDYYKGKVVILINETTQSQAEYTTMSFRAAPNATVIGSTTAGADGNVSEIVLPGDIRSMISGIGVYYPDKTETQRIGIVPDIELRPTIKGIIEGRDELLEKALEVIKVR